MRSPKRNRYRRFLSFGVLWPLTILMLSGCYIIPDEVQLELKDLRHQIGLLLLSVDTESRRVGRIEEFLTYCPDEVQHLIGRVEKECERSDTCNLSESDIRVELLKVAPWLGGKFLSLMQDRKHVAFYFNADGRPLKENEKKWLRDLIQPAWLADGARHTRFLVVSHPSDGSPEAHQQAEKRGKYVIREIQNIADKMGMEQPAAPPVASAVQAAGTPGGADAGLAVKHAAESQAAEKIDASPSQLPETSGASPKAHPRYILHWVIPFSRNGEQLRPEDRPRQAGDKLSSSVFVYRVEC